MFRSMGCKVFGALVALLLVGAVQAQTSFEFNLPAQALAESLKALASQTNTNVLVAPKLVDGRQAPAVKGKLTADEALSKLLAETGLRADRVNEKTVVLKRVDSATSNGTPADQMRVALVDEKNDGKGGEKGEQDVDDARTVVVENSRIKPFSDRNVDIPRTMDDAQPYYIYDAATIERSGATDIQEFLKQRLTMDATYRTNAQAYAGTTQSGGALKGNTSSFNLRGLGSSHTLILINGRRPAGVNHSTGGDGPPGINVAYDQPDLNGIPLSSIDRIEVLPTSASAIYGGSALGGIINVILKKDYLGGEIRATYKTTHDGKGPVKTISGTFGNGFEQGKSQLLVTAQVSQAMPMIAGDRREIVQRGYETILRNSPEYFTSSPGTPVLGATTNFGSLSGEVLTFKLDGSSLGSAFGTLAPGFSSSSGRDSIIGGKWDYSLPNSNQAPNGLRAPTGSSPETGALMATLRRQMTPKVEVFAEYTQTSNESTQIFNPFSSSWPVLSSASNNPFNQNIRVWVPYSFEAISKSKSESRVMTIGTIVALPKSWTAEIEYSRSDSKFSYIQRDGDLESFNNDTLSGVVNVFVDVSQFSTDLGKYIYTHSARTSGSVDDLSLRAAGTALRLPTGRARLAVGLQLRRDSHPQFVAESRFPLRPGDDVRRTYFPQSQANQSIYLEGDVPLVEAEREVPLVHALNLQAALRQDSYQVDAGTTGLVERLGQPLGPSNPSFFGTTMDGQRIEKRVSYSSHNETIGVKYAPFEDVAIRASYATAFRPPTYSQLLRSDKVNPNLLRVRDPKTGMFVMVQTMSGGNPDLLPQTSKSINIGMIWTPYSNTRVNLEYYRIRQFNQIVNQSVSFIVNNEGHFPGRVIRDASGAISLVDASAMNLYELENSGWDFSVGYHRDAGVGSIDLRLGGTYAAHDERQISVLLPKLEYAGYSGGANKYKANGSIVWERKNVSLSWTATYFGSYKQSGAPGDPQYGGNSAAPLNTFYLDAQGAYSIKAQTYHDLNISINLDGIGAGSRMGRVMGSAMSGLAIQGGVRNIFNTAPPFDAHQSGAPYFYSSFGNLRLRELWISVRKSFL